MTDRGPCRDISSIPRIGDELLPDPEGEELRDPDQAWQVARTTIRELLRAEAASPHLLKAVLEVSDAAGEIVLELPFSEVMIDPSDDAPDIVH